MKRSERKELYKCNTKGLIALMNDPRYINDKNAQFNAVIGYLARHGMQGGNSKEEFMDLVYAAKDEFLAQAAKERASSNGAKAYDDLGKNDARLKAFIRNPARSVQNEFTALAASKAGPQGEEDKDVVQFYNRIKVNANILAIELNIDANSPNLRPYKSDLVDVMNRLTKKLLDNRMSPEEALKKANSGVFGSLFRRESKEFTAFKEAFNQFKDPAKSYNSGNVDNLEEKTTAYLKHLIPEYKYSKDMPKQQLLSCLPKGQRARAEFAMNVMDSIHEHKEMKPTMANIDNAVNGRPVKEEAQPVANPIEQNKQVDFQKQLGNDIEPAQEKAENNIKVEDKVEAKEVENAENEMSI